MTEREIIEPFPFQPPSQALLDMLHWLDEAHFNFLYVYESEQLYACGELTPMQMDALLEGHAR